MKKGLIFTLSVIFVLTLAAFSVFADEGSSTCALSDSYVDPNTGLFFDTEQGLYYHPDYNLYIDEATGYCMDPETGLFFDSPAGFSGTSRGWALRASSSRKCRASSRTRWGEQRRIPNNAIA